MSRIAGVADSHFEGLPIGSLKNLRTEFFTETYYPEDDTQLLEPIVPEGIESVERYTSQSEPKLDNEFEYYLLGNQELPVSEHRKEILDSVRDNIFTIITAPTGSGKSTQVPQMLINAGYKKVYITQPRIVAARDIASRITYEFGDVLGEDKASKMVRFRSANESKGPSDAVVDVVTDGLQLVVELNTDKDNPEEVLIIDEAHEWNSQIEILIAWAKKSRNRRVVVMSATMDAKIIADYFADAVDKYPPVIEVEGRMHPVEFIEKPNSNVVEETLKAIPELLAETIFDEDAPNGILVFLPGLKEITDFMDAINKRLPPELADKVAMNPLYSKQTAEEQQRAQKKYLGKVNIIPATNVAQTSLTIAHIKYVIDSGYEKRIELNDEGVECLKLNPISQADCMQRTGRTGRVGPGISILTKLNDVELHLLFSERDRYPIPEILRSDIMRTTLRMAAIDLDITEFDLLHKLKLQDILRSQYHLVTLGALNENNKITKIGKRMNEFPLSPASARMMVEAEIKRFPKEIKAYLSAITASIDSGGLQLFGHNIGRNWNELTSETTSDLLGQLDIFIAAQSMNEYEMREYDLDAKNLNKSKDQYRKIAKIMNALVEGELLVPTAQEREDIKSCVRAGMVNHIYRSVGGGSYVPINDPTAIKEISNRSLVKSNHQIMFGKPYRVEIRRNGEVEEKHIIQDVTAGTIAELGRLALNYDWQPRGFNMRNGMFVKVVRQMLSGFDLGIEKEIPAEPSPALRQEIIDYVINNPGPQQKRLHKIKKVTEDFAHLTESHVEKLTNDKIRRLVSLAAPEDITDPTVIDNNLRLIQDGYMEAGEYANGITLETFIDSERQYEIMLNSPDEIEVEGVKLNITYRNGKALVKEYKTEDIAKLTKEVSLGGDRPVHFRFGTKNWTLIELKEKLGISSKQPEASLVQ